MQQTTLNRGWLIKIGIFLVAMTALGIWGLVDALIVFPNRGREHAEYTELQYLKKADEAGLILQAPIRAPREKLSELQANERALREEAAAAAAKGGSSRAQVDAAALEWLTSLSRVGMLDEKHTVMESPRARMETLADEWSQKNQPKALAAYDIPLQWVFVVGGFGVALYLVALILRTKAQVYKWNPETMALTLPDGRTFTPEQVREVDKRKWDKFYVFLKPKDGGAEIKLDLLRFKNLEEWILEFEKKTEGYEPPVDEETTADDKAPADAGPTS